MQAASAIGLNCKAFFNHHKHLTDFLKLCSTISAGRSCSDIFHSSICGKNCAIAQCLYSGQPVANLSITIDNAKGEKIPISISAAPLIDHDGNIIGGVETFRDLSTLASLPQKVDRVLQLKHTNLSAPTPRAQPMSALSPRQTVICRNWYGRDPFREDLFYRLNVVKIFLPPLREGEKTSPC